MSVLVRYPVPRPNLRIVRPPIPGPLYHFAPQPTINNICGFETGDTTELATATGGANVQSTIARSGGYALELPAGATSIWRPFDNKPKASDRHIPAFYYYPTSTTPTVDTFICLIRDSANDASLNIRFLTTGDVRLESEGSTTVGTVTDPLTANAWNLFEVFAENIDSGDVVLRINGVNEITSSGNDFRAPGGPWDHIQFRNDSGSDITTYIDDCYWRSGVSGITDSIGSILGDYEIFAYQKTDGGATDQGNALDTGTWALASETPAVTGAGNRGEYTTTDAAGSMRTNSGSRSGPSGDANIDGDSNIIAAKYTYILTTNVASDHFIRYGNDGDGTQERVATVGTGNTIVEVVSEDPAVTPLSTESFEIGGRANGANDLRFEELWCHILHTPDVVGVGGPPTGTLPMMGMGV